MLTGGCEARKRGVKHNSLIAQLVKNLPATQETLVQSLGQEDPLEKEMDKAPTELISAVGKGAGCSCPVEEMSGHSEWAGEQ